MNWKVYFKNVIEYGLEPTEESVGVYDDYEVVKNFTRAKESLILKIKQRRRELSFCIKDISKYRKSTFELPQNTLN